MLGWTLNRYLLTLFIKNFTFFFISIFILVCILDFTEHMDRLGDIKYYDPMQGLFLSILRAPSTIEKLFPFIILFSEMTTLISLNRHFELIIIRSFGISVWNFLFPSLFCSILLSLIVIFIINPIAIIGNEKVKNIIISWKNNEIQNIEFNNYHIPWFTQYTSDGAITIGAKFIQTKDFNLIYATFIRFNKEHKIIDWIFANKAKINKNCWVLLQGTQYQSGKIPKKFKLMYIKTILKPNIISEHFIDPYTVPFYSILSKIKISKILGYSTYSLSMRLQSILTLPLFFSAMLLIAAKFSIKFLRYQKIYYIFLKIILIGFFLYVIIIIMQSFGREGYISPIIAAWVPILFSNIIFILFLLYQEDG